MIRHIVLVQSDPSVPPSTLDQVFTELVGLRSRMPGVLSAEFGPSTSSENLERGYTHGLVMSFVDQAALATYLVDEEHQALGARLQRTARGGVDGILVVDLEI